MIDKNEISQAGELEAAPPPAVPAVPEILAASEEDYYDKLAEGRNTVVVSSRFRLRDLVTSEDWWVIWLGFAWIILVLAAKLISGTDLTAVKFPSWGSGTADAPAKILNADFITKYVLTWFSLTLTFSVGVAVMKKEKVGTYAFAFSGLYILASLAYFLSAHVTMKQYLEYAFWALLIGLIIANTIGTPAWIRPALKSEYYVKTGLVLMGAEVLFSNITRFGFYGLGIAWIVVPLVIIFMWWLGTKALKMNNRAMIMVIAVATSVCGVSAAIAAAAAAKAKKNDLTFAVSLSMLFTVLMMIFMPFIVNISGMDPLIGGAWIGNTVDSTGAVVLAGEAVGEVGAQAATLVKMIQNVLIGFIAFAVAIFFARNPETRQMNPDGTRVRASVGPGEVWDRLPKFIIGFFIASFFFSLVLQPQLGVETTNQIIANLGTYKGWAFCLAFLCIGLETDFKSMASQMEHGKPLSLYLIGQTFSLILSLIICWIFLSGTFFPVPDLRVFGG